MKSKIEMDDMSVGMLITVLRGKIMPFGGEDKKYNGAVIHVQAVEYPYIVAIAYNGISTFNRSFDMREWSFIRLSKEYVEAIHPDIDFYPEADTTYDDNTIENILKASEEDDNIRDTFKDL